MRPPGTSTLDQQQGDLDHAIADYTTVLRQPEQRRVDSAIADLTDAIALNPNDALAYHFRAAAHEAKKDLKQAELDAAAALRLHPKGWGHSR